jgi:sporulation integral membrane protein YtvI
MTYDEKRKFIVNIVYIITLFAVVYFVFKYAIQWVLPFIIGFLIASVLKPITESITKLTRIKRNGIVSVFVIGVFYFIIVISIWFLTAFLWNELSELIKILPTLYFDKIEPLLLDVNNWIVERVETLSPEFADTLSNMIVSGLQYLATVIKNLSIYLVSAITNIISNLPLYLISVIFTIVCSFFISVDYKNITSFIRRQLPDRFDSNLVEAKRFLSGTLLKMIKAYAIILSITFIEMIIGMSILNVKYGLPIAAIVAVLDILPLVGTGGILVPWAIIELISKDYRSGLGLLIIYAVITIVRNIIEPRIIGHQIGLNPVVTITAMYAGLRIFGFTGFILAPITSILIKHLNDTGRIHIYKS